MQLAEFLNHLKDVASSPLAFVAYLGLVGAWAYVLVARHRLNIIAKTITALPAESRAEILLREYNTTPRAGLSAEQWIRAQRERLLFLSFIASLIVALAIASMALSGLGKPLRRSARLALVDVVASDKDFGSVIEFKVRNNSDEAVFIKKAVFLTLAEWDLVTPGAHPSAIPVSRTYDVTISASIGQSVTHNVSQGLAPNSVDRFAFRIGAVHKKYPFVGLFVYLIKIRLLYDEDNRVVESPNILMNLPPPMSVMGLSFDHPPLAELEANRNAAREILLKSGKSVVCSDELLKAITSWADADFSRVAEH
jgi:hypothetical protein